SDLTRMVMLLSATAASGLRAVHPMRALPWSARNRARFRTPRLGCAQYLQAVQSRDCSSARDHDRAHAPRNVAVRRRQKWRAEVRTRVAGLPAMGTRLARPIAWSGDAARRDRASDADIRARASPPNHTHR